MQEADGAEQLIEHYLEELVEIDPRYQPALEAIERINRLRQ